MTTWHETAPATKGLVLHRAVGYDVLVWLLTHGRIADMSPLPTNMFDILLDAVGNALVDATV
jgi:hypothetical protein